MTGKAGKVCFFLERRSEKMRKKISSIGMYKIHFSVVSKCSLLIATFSEEEEEVLIRKAL